MDLWSMIELQCTEKSELRITICKIITNMKSNKFYLKSKYL